MKARISGMSAGVAGRMFSIKVVGCWLLVAGCWLLVAGCWLLVAGCWLFVAGWWGGAVGLDFAGKIGGESGQHSADLQREDFGGFGLL